MFEKISQLIIIDNKLPIDHSVRGAINIYVKRLIIFVLFVLVILAVMVASIVLSLSLSLSPVNTIVVFVLLTVTVSTSITFFSAVSHIAAQNEKGNAEDINRLFIEFNQD